MPGIRVKAAGRSAGVRPGSASLPQPSSRSRKLYCMPQAAWQSAVAMQRPPRQAQNPCPICCDLSPIASVQACWNMHAAPVSVPVRVSVSVTQHHCLPAQHAALAACPTLCHACSPDPTCTPVPPPRLSTLRCRRRLYVRWRLPDCRRPGSSGAARGTHGSGHGGSHGPLPEPSRAPHMHPRRRPLG